MQVKGTKFISIFVSAVVVITTINICVFFFAITFFFHKSLLIIKNKRILKFYFKTLCVVPTYIYVIRVDFYVNKGERKKGGEGCTYFKKFIQPNLYFCFFVSF